MSLKLKVNTKKLKKLGYEYIENRCWLKKVNYYGADWWLAFDTENNEPEIVRSYNIEQISSEDTDNYFQLLSFVRKEDVELFHDELDEMWGELEQDLKKVLENDEKI